MMTAFLYHKGKPVETDISRARIFEALGEKESLLWVDLENPNEFEEDCLVELFNFHPLAIEDCLNDQSQPKVDDYEEYLFLVMHAIRLAAVEETGELKLDTVELDIFLGKNYVVTFHKEPLKTIDQVREVVRKKPEICMGHGADMLVHALLDHLVDNYQPVIDAYDHKIDKLEDEIFGEASAKFLPCVIQAKRDLFYLRRIISPQRDTINYLTRNPTTFIKPRHIIYFRDVYDHLFRTYGILEGLHEVIAGMLQAYFSYSSQKLNEVIKRLTVIATIGMPPVIIASIYGMNFRHMPELDHPYGYLFSLALMGGTSLATVLFMKFKKWI